MTNPVGRRTFIVGGLTAGLTTTTTAPGQGQGRAQADTRPGSRPRYVDVDPFTQGVASGDASWDSVVLWTRLAVDPLQDDGLGGMAEQAVPVEWEVAHDPDFTTGVRRGTVDATPEFAHSVHLELGGLEASRWYWYRFKVGRWMSQTGRTRTSPSPRQRPRRLNVAMTSCASYPDGYFSAYRGVADENVDLILALGDYIYEYPYTYPGHIRYVYGPETKTLANYRQRYAQYKTDPDLQAAHAAAPWLATWDDHEIENNWAGDNPPNDPAPPAEWEARRIAAARAYWENMPFRQSAFPSGKHMQVYRRVGWGQLATFHVLDTRQFRDDQGGGQPPLGCGDGYRYDCPAALDPKRTLMGFEQEAWLLDGFQRSRVQWDVLAQQVYFGERDADPGPRRYVSMDGWTGYVGNRTRVTDGWVNSPVKNAVVLTGDVHAAWACDLKRDYINDPAGETVGVEFVATSIASGRDGFDVDPVTHPFVDWNPGLRYYNALRGYVRLEFTLSEVTAHYRDVLYVTRPGATPFTRTSWVSQAGEPGLHQTANNPPTKTFDVPGDLVEHTIWMETEEYP